jgi:hypothetical protein
VRRKRIPARKGNAGQWLVQLPDELQADPDAATGPANGDTLAELLAEVAELRERLGHATGLAEGRAAQIADLHEQIAELRKPWWRRMFGP